MGNPIFTRTSIRKFTDEAVTDEQIDQLMKAAMAAPSAGNQQPWEFYVTSDADLKRELAECSPYAKPAANAHAVIIPCIKSSDMRFPEYAPIDLSICCENILLEVENLGLGAVWLGIYPESERIDAVAQCASIPDGLTPFALIAIGHPAEDVSPRSAKRYEPDRVHWL